MLDVGVYKTPIQNVHKIGWKENYFKYDDVSMLGHGYGVSQFPQFQDEIKNKYQLLPHPYVESYLGEKGHIVLQETWVPALDKSVEIFVTVLISDRPNIKYWQNLVNNMDNSKQKIPKQCRIGDECST